MLRVYSDKDEKCMITATRYMSYLLHVVVTLSLKYQINLHGKSIHISPFLWV